MFVLYVYRKQRNEEIVSEQISKGKKPRDNKSIQKTFWGHWWFNMK